MFQSITQKTLGLFYNANAIFELSQTICLKIIFENSVDNFKIVLKRCLISGGVPFPIKEVYNLLYITVSCVV